MNNIGFVIPCYRSELTIENVIKEIHRKMDERPDYTYEIICVNDCSPDTVWDVLKKMVRNDSKLRIIYLSCNVGKSSAQMAGLHYINSEYIVLLDDDGQCPMDRLWDLTDPLMRDECDVSTARYTHKKQTLWKNMGSNMNVAMGRVLLNKPKGLRFENFLVLKRFVIDEIVNYDFPYPYLEGLILRVTRRIKMIDMVERERGDNKKTGFTFSKSLSLWTNGFTAFSVKPLRLASIIGTIAAVAGFIYGIVAVIIKIANPNKILSGYTSVIVILLFVGGLMLLSLGLLGEYVGRIYICISKAPQFIVRNMMSHETEHKE